MGKKKPVPPPRPPTPEPESESEPEVEMSESEVENEVKEEKREKEVDSQQVLQCREYIQTFMNNEIPKGMPVESAEALKSIVIKEQMVMLHTIKQELEEAKYHMKILKCENVLLSQEMTRVQQEKKELNERLVFITDQYITSLKEKK